MKSQIDNIFHYLNSGKSLTPLQALKKFGCFRLGARIYELRKIGIKINSQTVKSGDKHFSSYFLAR